jgi:hypothetical protein
VAEDFDDIDRRLASCTGYLTLSQSALNNAMLSRMSPRAENAPSRESPASPPSPPPPPPPPPKQESNSRGYTLHDGDVEVLRSWRKQNGVLAKLWPIDACPTTWDGVRFDSSTPRRVTEIELSNKGLGGSIPKELGQLASLQILLLHDNELSGSIPQELGQLASLKELKLNDNQLSGSIPKELGQLASLKELELSSKSGIMTSAVFDALRRWRSRRAKEMGKPLFVVFDDKTLLGIAQKRPATLSALGDIKGVVPKKKQDYGNEVLDIMRGLGGDAAGGARGGSASTSSLAAAWGMAAGAPGEGSEKKTTTSTTSRTAPVFESKKRRLGTTLSGGHGAPRGGGLADALQRLYAMGVVQPHQLDAKMHEHLASMPEHTAVAAIDELAGADVSGIRNMNGYLMSICHSSSIHRH